MGIELQQGNTAELVERIKQINGDIIHAERMSSGNYFVRTHNYLAKYVALPFVSGMFAQYVTPNLWANGLFFGAVGWMGRIAEDNNVGDNYERLRNEVNEIRTKAFRESDETALLESTGLISRLNMLKEVKSAGGRKNLADGLTAILSGTSATVGAYVGKHLDF